MSRFPDQKLYWTLTAELGLLPPLAVVVLSGFLLVSGADALRQISLPAFLSTSWLPLQAHFGLLPMVVGTLSSTAIALCLAVPIGLSAAVYLALYTSPRVRTVADACVALLGSMPSVVIGLWGLTWIVPAVGNSLAAAGLVLATMIAPTFTLLAGAALRQVPADLIETVRALGVSEQTMAGVVVRHARWGILGAAILAASRGLGEAVAISMVAGNVPGWPALTGPIATLTTTLIVEFDAATGLHRSALYVLTLLVMALIIGISLIGRFVERRN